MRKRIAEVAELTRDALLDWDEAMDAQSGMTDEELAKRYANQHKGNPRAIMRFAEKNAPDGTDPLDAAVEYERTMEDLLRTYRRNDAD